MTTVRFVFFDEQESSSYTTIHSHPGNKTMQCGTELVRKIASNAFVQECIIQSRPAQTRSV